jgi:hypothetical protein
MATLVFVEFRAYHNPASSAAHRSHQQEGEPALSALIHCRNKTTRKMTQSSSSKPMALEAASSSA